MSIPDEGSPTIHPLVADATTKLEAMRAVCYQLLQIFETLCNVSNTAKLGGHHALRDSAISETYPQLELVRVACCQLLQVLGLPNNISTALGGSQIIQNSAISGMYLQVTLTAPQLGFVRDTHYQLLQVYGSLHDELNATQPGGHQVLLTRRYQVALAVVTRLKFVLVACYQLLQVYGLPLFEHLGCHRMLVDNASHLQHPIAEAVQPTNAQQAGVPTGGDTPSRLHCIYENCEATFGRLQERKRHHIDVHKPRRKCPLCPYKWCRPSKIKIHLMVNHKERLSQEVLNEISAKRGLHLVLFLTTLCDTVNTSLPQRFS